MKHIFMSYLGLHLNSKTARVILQHPKNSNLTLIGFGKVSEFAPVSKATHIQQSILSSFIDPPNLDIPLKRHDPGFGQLLLNCP